jgi:ATP-binding cassette subfamily F protein 3
MGHCLFTGDDIIKPIGALSGGELSRVAIAKLILGNANVLLLDEPTNHLDIASREALESALTDYPGTLIMVSHDRALIDRFAERLIVVEHGHATVHLGNYTDYRWKQSQLSQQAAEEAARQATKSRAPKYRPDRTEENALRKRRQRFTEVETEIEKVEGYIQDIEARFPTLDPADYQLAQELTAEYEAMKQRLGHLYEEWEELAS